MFSLRDEKVFTPYYFFLKILSSHFRKLFSDEFKRASKGNVTQLIISKYDTIFFFVLLLQFIIIISTVNI